MNPGLFGLENSNRDFTMEKYWGKNYFTNAFPVSLACYMHQKNLKPVYIVHSLDNEQSTNHTKISVGKLFGLNPSSDTVYYAFESDYVPYRPFVVGTAPPADIVFHKLSNDKCVGHLELKLTALPDNSTYKLPEEEYGSELVVRYQTIFYLALTLVKSYARKRSRLSNLLYPVSSKIPDWSNKAAIIAHLEDIKGVLEEIIKDAISAQSPFIMQPIWKTIKKKPLLSDNCFDVFVWSNLAFMRLFLDELLAEKNQLSRPQRAAAWLVKMLYDYADRGSIDYKSIFSNMTFDLQSDKAFAVNGRKTNKYMKSQELKNPRIQKTDINKIILGGGQKLLSPERRLDMVLFFSDDLFFGEGIV